MLCVAVATQAARPEHGLGKDFSDADGANSALWLGGGRQGRCRIVPSRPAELHIVQVGVASDKLVQQLAKHPKARRNSYGTQASEPQCQVGCEAVTKMVESFVLAASTGLSLHSSFSACAR